MAVDVWLHYRRSLTAPADVTELCLALEAARQQAGWPAASGHIPAL